MFPLRRTYECAHIVNPRDGPLEWLLIATGLSLVVTAGERLPERAISAMTTWLADAFPARMSLSFEAVRAWAIARATDWALDAEANDRLEIDTLRPAGALRIEVFNLLLPLAATFAGFTSDLGVTGWRGAVKTKAVDRSLRARALRTMAWFRPSTGGSMRTDVAFLSELATPSSLEPMLAVAAAIESSRRRPISADPRAHRTWMSHGGDPMPSLIGLREELAMLRSISRDADARWRAMRNDPPEFSLGGRDITAPAMDRLEPLVRRSVPWLAVERAGVARALDVLQPRRLVLASDQHRVGRLAVDLARERGIRTVVLQHGHPMGSLGYLPVFANSLATWSERSDAWFIAGGTDPARLIRLGNPRLDKLAVADRALQTASVTQRTGLRGAPRILLALSPSDGVRNLALLDLALDVLASLPSAALVVKLHPGEGKWSKVHDRVRHSGSIRDRVKVVRLEPLYPLLAWADAVVVHRSTVAIEALAAGTPVIIGAIGEPTFEDDLDPDLDLPKVTDLPSLTACLMALTKPDARRSFIESRRDLLERTTGPLDGRVAERIAAILLEGPPP